MTKRYEIESKIEKKSLDDFERFMFLFVFLHFILFFISISIVLLFNNNFCIFGKSTDTVVFIQKYILETDTVCNSTGSIQEEMKCSLWYLNLIYGLCENF